MVQANRADMQRDAAQSAAVRAGLVAGFLTNVLRLSDPNRTLGETITVTDAVDSAARWLERDLGETPDALADIAAVLGDLFGAMGRVELHRTFSDSAFRVRERLLGPQHPELARPLVSIAEAMRGQGLLAESEPILRRALLLAQKDSALSVTVDHILNMLALSLRDQGRLDEGERIMRDALVISRRNASVHPTGLHRSLTNLGHIRLAQGSIDEAKSLYAEVLTLRRAHWGERHPEVANALINVAQANAAGNNFAEAEQLFVEGLAMRRETQGSEHSEIGIDLVGLAQLYHRQGQIERAETTYRTAVLSRTRGRLHPAAVAAAESITVIERSRRTYSGPTIFR